MVKIKICGITSEDEINYLNLLKPDYVGFVFAQSKRKINKDKAEKLCSKLISNIKKAGVFRNQTIEEIVDILNTVNLDVIQLHGKEDIDFIRCLREKTNDHIEIWKTVSIENINEIEKYSKEEYEDNAKNITAKKLIDKFLIDGQNPGSGKAYPLDPLNKYLNNNINHVDFFLAGGITPENVRNKVLEIKPFGIDVSSGVEITDERGQRKKSLDKMIKLIKEVEDI